MRRKGREQEVKQEVKLTRQQKKLMEASLLIARDQPTSQDKAFLARHLVQTTLPHADPGNVAVWSRRNGNLTLTIQQGYAPDGTPYGHPYGVIPRLLMYWMTTEALRTKKHRLELGNNLAEFMYEIGLDPKRQGPRSDRARLQEQMTRLYEATISFDAHIEDHKREGILRNRMLIATERMFWWDKTQPQQSALWESHLTLDARFYEAITANPVPVDLRALRAIKRSPLALDLYSLLTYQAFKASNRDQPCFMSWKQLQAALGTTYADTANFRKAVKPALLKIQSVYPRLAIGEREGGIEVLPDSLPSIAIR